MEKRYNLQLVDAESRKVVHEIELLHTTTEDDGEVYIDNPIHITFVELENAIAEDQRED